MQSLNRILGLASSTHIQGKLLKPASVFYVLRLTGFKVTKVIRLDKLFLPVYPQILLTRQQRNKPAYDYVQKFDPLGKVRDVAARGNL